jgi:hypothetical protein
MNLIGLLAATLIVANQGGGSVSYRRLVAADSKRASSCATSRTRW